MKGWNIKRFGDMYSIPSRNGLMRPSAVRGKGYKMINMGELFAYPRINNPPMELVELDEEEKKNFNIITGDLLFARQSLVAEGAGKCSIVIGFEEPTTFESHLIRVRLNKSDAVSLFYYYYFRSQTGFGSIQTLVNQVSAAGIRGSDLSRLKVLYPSLPIQKKIVAILSAYDDLIENNNRRIAILEKIADELYREWFVRLRFPGHEKIKIIKGVPEGWEIKELKDIAEESSKSTKPGAHLSDRYYLPIDLLNHRGFLPSGHLDFTEAQSSLLLFQKNDILFGAMRPYLHKVCLAPFNGITRTTCFVIKPIDERFYSWLYLLLFQNSTIEYATLICNGADRPYVVWNKSFERMKILRPNAEIAHNFNQKIRPVLDYIQSHYFLLQNLKLCRDRLLSRLMGGKIDVENMDIQFPISMQEELVHA